MSFIKEETISLDKSLEHSESKLDDELKKTGQQNFKYENWFLIHSGMKKKEDLYIAEVNKNQPPYYEERSLKESVTGNSKEIDNIPNETIFDYDAWFDKHSVKSEIKEVVYTPICKKYYPLILTPINKNKTNICKKDSKRFTYFCFTCNNHFCPKCKTDHIGHSFISLEEIKIKEQELINERNSVQNKISSQFSKYLNEQLDNNSKKIIMKSIDEIIKFNYYVINSYRRDKNNFYNYFNYYYLYRLKEDLKNKENNLIKKFFGFHGFKKLINDLKYFYEKTKVRWLLKNLINYKKKEIKEKVIKKRKEDYNFENLDTLLKNEGFEEHLISKMKEIIKEVKNVNFKKRIFNFIIETVDAFKSNQEKYLKELNLILEQVKVDFKQLVKEKVGETEDVKKFVKKENCSYYNENNDRNNKYVNNREEIHENNVVNRNEINNTIYLEDETEKKGKKKKNNEYDLYNGFKVNSYEPEYQYVRLDISNTFKANNNNNNYIEKTGKLIDKNNNYTYTTINNYYIPEKQNKDILKSLKNINQKKETEFVIRVDASNTIVANTNNNKIEISTLNEVVENSNIEKTKTINHNKGIYNNCLEEEKKTKNNKEDITSDILNNAIIENNKKDIEVKTGVYTINNNNNCTEVNNYNNQISKTNIDISIKNENIKNNYEINKEKYQPKDSDSNYKTETMNKDNNKFIGSSFDNHDKKIINNYSSQLIGPPLENNKCSENIDVINKRGNIGKVYYFKIKGSNRGRVWGYNIYSDDSNIAQSAVLEGKCKLGEETIVGIKMIEGQSSYESINKNGVNSYTWGYWPGSYIFI